MSSVEDDNDNTYQSHNETDMDDVNIALNFLNHWRYTSDQSTITSNDNQVYPAYSTFTLPLYGPTEEQSFYLQAIADTVHQLQVLQQQGNNSNKESLKNSQSKDKYDYLSTLSHQEAQYIIYGWWRRELKTFKYEFPKAIIELSLKWYYDTKANTNFIAQPLLSFNDALDILINGHCAFGVYDFKSKIWRTAIYMKHWQDKQRIMLTYTATEKEMRSNDHIDYDKLDNFVVLKIFPTNTVQIDEQRFRATEGDLRKWGEIPLEKIDEWVKREESRKKKYDRDNIHSNNEDSLDNLLRLAIAASIQNE